MSHGDDGGAGPSAAECAARLRGDGLGFDDSGALVPIVEFDFQVIDGEPEAPKRDLFDIALEACLIPGSVPYFARKEGVCERSLRREVVFAREYLRQLRKSGRPRR